MSDPADRIAFKIFKAVEGEANEQILSTLVNLLGFYLGQIACGDCRARFAEKLTAHIPTILADANAVASAIPQANHQSPH